LLEMAGYTMSRLEFTLACFRDHLGNDLYGVSLRSLLVDEDDFAGSGVANVFLEHLSEMVDVTIQHFDVDTLFWCVDSERADTEACNSRDITRLATLSFDDEYATSRGGSRLATGIGVLN
jgi:hypothetical protein